MTDRKESYYAYADHRLVGVLAEVASVLEGAAAGEHLSGDAELWGQIVTALDVTHPPEERVPVATKVIRQIISQNTISRWIPWYEQLADHEFHNEFYSAYRDHTIHTLQTYLLGLYLYETVSPLRESLDGRLEPSGYEGDPLTRFREWWSLSALWHDSGYPFETVDFTGSTEHRNKLYDKLSGALTRDCFLRGLEHAGILEPGDNPRKCYQAGRFYPFSVNSTAMLTEHSGANERFGALWQRCGYPLDAENLIVRLDRVSTSAPVGRPPFHDHGLIGGCLLAFLYDETLSFLTNLTDDEQFSESVFEDYLVVSESSDLVGLAIESIAYHNLNLAFFDDRELVAMGVVPRAGERPQVSLGKEPHAFFLALADTLQDWDRHRFEPAQPGTRPRPATRSSEMLLQGDGGRILIELQGNQDPVSTIKKLFNGWLDSADVALLFGKGAKFSQPSKVRATSKVSLEDQDKSKSRCDRLVDLVDRNVQSARELLISGGVSTVAEACAVVAALEDEISDTRPSLVLSDERRLDAALRKVVQLQRLSHGLLDKGVQLPMGLIVDTLGDGGFGKVWLLRSEGPQSSQFAFKAFHGRDIDLTEKVRLFRRGYRAMRRLTLSRNIVSVHQLTRVPLGFSMEYVPGMDLGRLRLSDLLVSERMELMIKVASAVAFAHGKGVVHRDIKPGNILIDSTDSDEPVLTDFDLAWIDGRTQNTKAQYATLHYGAPEQFESKIIKTQTEPTVDLYGLGAMTFFVLTLREPPVLANWQPEHWSVLRGSLEGVVPATVVPWLEELIRKSTQKNPKDRMSSAELFIAQLSRIVSFSKHSSGSVSTADWLTEVCAVAAGTAATPETFASRSGGLTWFGAGLKRGAFTVECSLNRDPTYEGVNYQGFRKGSVRQVDARLRSFEEDWPDCTVRRSGQMASVGQSLKLTVQKVELTLSHARAVGELLASIARIIE